MSIELALQEHADLETSISRNEISHVEMFVYIEIKMFKRWLMPYIIIILYIHAYHMYIYWIFTTS